MIFRSREASGDAIKDTQNIVLDNSRACACQPKS